VEKRPEIRKVFPPRGGGPGASAGSPPRAIAGRGARPGVTVPSTRPAAPASTPIASAAASGATVREGTATERFAIQIAALNDPLRAKDAVQKLKASGVPAYLLNPPASDPDAPYRVRVGPYRSREEAQKAAATLEEQRNEKFWVTRER
jgi:DedD protein